MRVSKRDQQDHPDVPGSDRRFAAGVLLVLVLAAVVLVAGTRQSSDRVAAGPSLRAVPERPPASVSSVTEVARPSSPRTRRELRDPRAQGGRVVVDDVLARLARLRGAPVVVNVWASWCPNCRDEFKYFKRSSEEYDGKVAFLGLDSKDDRGAAAEFLAEFPVPYPSIDDPDAEQARSIGAGVGWPTTIFYGADGKRRFVRQGGYVSQEALDEDIRTYAVG